MITSLDQLDLEKKYSYADYLTWRLDEYVELLRGRISRMAAPTKSHQRVVVRMTSLWDTFLKNSSCKIFVAPFDVRLLDQKKSTANKDIYTVVQPDVCVVCDPLKLEEKGCLGAPDLVVEVLSPGTQQKDIKDKFELYEFNGVKEYWIVSAADETITIFNLDDAGIFQFRKIHIGDESEVNAKVIEGFSFKLIDLFSAKY